MAVVTAERLRAFKQRIDELYTDNKSPWAGWTLDEFKLMLDSAAKLRAQGQQFLDPTAWVTKHRAGG